MKAVRQNFTLRLPEPLLDRFRAYAAKRKQSLSVIAASVIRQLLKAEQDERKRTKQA